MDLDAAAMPPPEGIDSNFDDPANQNGLAWGVLIACVAVATLSLFLRAYARVYLLRKVQAEEVLILLAYGAYWGSIYATFRLVEQPGYFVHTWDVRFRDLIPVTYWIFIFGVCYSFVLPFVKIAILIEWVRIFLPRNTRNKSPFFWGCMFICFVQVTAGIAIVVALNTQCIPHQGIWDFTIERKCFDLHQLQIASATIHLACDVIMLLLPQHIIWTLQMSWKKRLGVSVVFGLGLLACVSAAFRLSTTLAYGKSADSLYSLGPLVFWATAEMSCGFFVVCVPCIPKILKDTGMMKKIKRVFGMKASTTGMSNKNTNGYGTGYGSGSNTLNSKLGNASKDNYYKLDDPGVQMNTLKGSESTEHLQNASPKDGITRITRITVTQEARPGSDDDSIEHKSSAWR